MVTRLPPDAPVALRRWEAAGTYRELADHEVFTLERPPSSAERLEPLLVVHGFPTCSFDFRLVLDALAEERRVLLLDLVGFGLSEKPDRPYTIALQADVVAALTEELGLERLSLLTHDMGDTVGGELLARQREGRWPVEVRRRVVTNGSIYIEMAHLTPGQLGLLALPDAALAEGPDATAVAGALADTMAPGAQAREGLDDDAYAVCHRQGNRLLARTIRYIEERRRHQDRFTGAIEAHDSPLDIVWGAEDPIAVAPMATRLQESRPASTLRWLAGSGHYPMLEAPEQFAAAVLAGDEPA